MSEGSILTSDQCGRDSGESCVDECAVEVKRARVQAGTQTGRSRKNEG